MFTKGAVEDLIAEHLSRNEGAGAAPARKKAGAPVKKVFLSDWELRRLCRPGDRTVTVPANAILSPLSLDWIEYNGVKIVRQ